MFGRNAKDFFTNFLKSLDIEINGSRPWDITIEDERLYKRIITEGSLGFGEAYMDGWWECKAIDQFLTKVLRKVSLNASINTNPAIRAYRFLAGILNFQTPSRSFKVGEQHYDAGNELYKRMLDKRMLYTCAYWKNAQSLDEAQEAKLDLICKKIGLKEGMKVLELGCGFGSFARFAAEKYGARVHGVTVSREQARLGNKMCSGLPVKLEVKDYRSVDGNYDAVISIGIMEHIGHKNYRTYMEVANRCLKKDGVAFIHTIGGNKSVTMTEPWLDKYIFPGGMLPSLAQLSGSMEGLFVVEDVHNFGPDYDRTLMEWYKNFNAAWSEIAHLYDERFKRMWDYYLLCCAAVFRSRTAQLWQIVMTKPGTKQPQCRFG